MSEASTGVIVPAFTSLSILCMKASYEDTCATPLSREDLQQMTNESAGKLQQNLRTSSKKLRRGSRGAPMIGLDPP